MRVEFLVKIFFFCSECTLWIWLLDMLPFHMKVFVDFLSIYTCIYIYIYIFFFFTIVTRAKLKLSNFKSRLWAPSIHWDYMIFCSKFGLWLMIVLEKYNASTLAGITQAKPNKQNIIVHKLWATSQCNSPTGLAQTTPIHNTYMATPIHNTYMAFPQIIYS